MFIFLLVIQVIVSILLVIMILMQSGRGGGLVESFSNMESILGAKTNTFLVRATTVLATLFLLNCLCLTYLSTQRNKSLMEKQGTLQEESARADTNQENVVEEQAIEEPLLLPEEFLEETAPEHLDAFPIAEPEEEKVDKINFQE